MNDLLDVEIILKKQKFHFIYNIGIILLIILLIFLYISFIYEYKTYYISTGTIYNGNLKLLVKIEDLKYISNNNQIKINNNYYTYKIDHINEELYVDEAFNNYKEIYLDVSNLNNVTNNYVYEIKIEAESKKIIEYLKEYL